MVGDVLSWHRPISHVQTSQDIEDNQLCGLSSCSAIAIWVDFSDSISITAQCIETQLMPNESSGKDL